VINYWYMMNGAQQIVGGLLAYAFSQIKHKSYRPDPGIASLRLWQAIFVTYDKNVSKWLKADEYIVEESTGGLDNVP
jgi:hypothetical protein